MEVHINRNVIKIAIFMGMVWAIAAFWHTTDVMSWPGPYIMATAVTAFSVVVGTMVALVEW